MPDAAPNPELLRSLGRLVRGLSALFWGLPAAFMVCFYTARVEALKPFGVVPPLACTGLLAYGLWLLGAFQKQERVWRQALDRARLLSLMNVGLSPFLYWWNRIPANSFFLAMVLLMSVCATIWLGSLNVVLRRLGAMLPDETLRAETRQFTALNLNLLLVITVIWVAYLFIDQLHNLPPWLSMAVFVMARGNYWFLWCLLLLALVPLAMTMALLWKTKEVILDSVFGTDR